MKRIYLALFLLVSQANAEEPLKVVATLSTFGSLVQAVGGERVDVHVVAYPKFNPHFIEPRPSDVLKLKRADLFVHGGLDLEAWRGPLLDAAGNIEVREGGSRSLDLSAGVALVEVPTGPISRAQGDIHLFGNPHYWLSPQNGLVMVQTIYAKLAELDPMGARVYKAKADAVSSRIRAVQESWNKKLASSRGAKLIGFHNEWVYLVDPFGMSMDLFLEPKPGIQPSARHLEELSVSGKAEGVKAVIYAGYNSAESAEHLADSLGVKALRLCQNVGQEDGCTDYPATLDYNLGLIASVLN